MISWNPDVLDRYAAPGISKFVSASIPDVSSEFGESPHWLSNHFLNRVLSDSQYKYPHSLYALNNLKATQFLFYEHATARTATLNYLAASNPTNPLLADYFDCIHHWSNVFLQYSVAVDTWNKFTSSLDASASKVFAPDDGSREQRAYEVANDVKHIPAQKPEASLSIWLTNDGVESFRYQISFLEIADNLRDAGRMADLIQDPLTLAGKR